MKFRHCNNISYITVFSYKISNPKITKLTNYNPTKKDVFLLSVNKKEIETVPMKINSKGQTQKKISSRCACSNIVCLLSKLYIPSTHYTLLTAEIIKWQKCADMGLNGFHTK